LHSWEKPTPKKIVVKTTTAHNHRPRQIRIDTDEPPVRHVVPYALDNPLPIRIVPQKLGRAENKRRPAKFTTESKTLSLSLEEPSSSIDPQLGGREEGTVMGNAFPLGVGDRGKVDNLNGRELPYCQQYQLELKSANFITESTTHSLCLEEEKSLANTDEWWLAPTPPVYTQGG